MKVKAVFTIHQTAVRLGAGADWPIPRRARSTQGAMLLYKYTRSTAYFMTLSLDQAVRSKVWYKSSDLRCWQLTFLFLDPLLCSTCIQGWWLLITRLFTSCTTRWSL